MNEEKSNADQKKIDDILRRMLSTPPQTQKPKKKTKKSDK